MLRTLLVRVLVALVAVGGFAATPTCAEQCEDIVSGVGNGRDHWLGFAFSIFPDRPMGEPTKENLLEDNRKISAAYANMYLSDPNTFKWAGMAAWASATVGGGMDLSSSFWRHSSVPWDRSTWVSQDQVFWLLAKGNGLVFMDVYWQHVAYRECGLRALEAVRAANAKAWPTSESNEGRDTSRDAVSSAALEAWGKIDRGRRTGNSELVWQGNEQLLRYEQQLLQKHVYDEDRSLWRRISDEIDSPIPGHDENFHDVVEDGDFGFFLERWKYIEASLLPAFREWDRNYRTDK